MEDNIINQYGLIPIAVFITSRLPSPEIQWM